MPVVDETIHTLEIKKLRSDLTGMIERLEKRVADLEARVPKGK